MATRSSPQLPPGTLAEISPTDIFSSGDISGKNDRKIRYRYPRSWTSNFEKILDQLLPVGGKHAFRMELNPFNRESPVAQAHDDTRAIPHRGAGTDFQIAWDCLFRD